MTDVYGTVFGRWLFPAWETWVRRRPTLPLQRYLEQTQWRSLDELEATQLGELRRLLQHAYDNVPLYRQRFTAVGFHPRDLRSLADLGRLPILKKAEASTEVEARTATAGAKVEIKKSTSGTMGQPLSFGYDRPSETWRQATRLRGYAWAGYTPGKRTLHYWGASSPFLSRAAKAKADLDHALKRERYIDCGRRGIAELDAVIAQIESAPPEVLLCYSQAGADLARRILERGGKRWRDIHVICGAERLLPTDRTALEQAFGPHVFETYGCREVMLIGSECEQHQGLHVSMENLVVEVVVRQTTPAGIETVRAAEPGEIGEVVITDLHNWAMPFIRYANGDLATYAEPGRCPCGRTLPRLSSVEGRVTETLTDGRGNRVNGLVFNVVIAHLGGAIRQFQIVQRKDKSITMRVVPGSTFDERTEGTLRDVWQKYLPGVSFTLEKVEAIETNPSGKRRVVVVES